MDSQSNSASNSASPTARCLIPHRPSIFRSHLSVTFSTLRTVIPLRRRTPRRETDERPITAPPTYRGSEHRYFVPGQASRKRPSIHQIHTSSLADSEPLFPFEELRYHSCPSINLSPCTFCGMRSAYRPSLSEPCEDCRSRSPFSHMGMVLRPKSRVKSNQKAQSHSRETLSRQSASSDEAPRIATPEIAAMRAGNPPRKARLPVTRPGASNKVLNPPPGHSGSQSPCLESVFPSTRADQWRKSAPDSDKVRPTSPKLHHVHGLPNSKAYPYVRKSEVPQHFVAIRAGAPSPLAGFAHDVREKRSRVDRSTDFTETVHYGKLPKPALVADVRKRRQGQLERSHVVEELPMGQSELAELLLGELQYGREQLDHNSTYRGPKPEQESPRSSFARLFDRQGDHTRMTSEDNEPASKGRKSGLKKDTTTTHKAEGILRGGGGDEIATYSRRELLVKHLLPTCHSPDHRCSTTSSSDDEDIPARHPHPVRIARAKQRAHGTARLPRHMSCISLTPPALSLRGGAGSPSTLRDYERVPPTLLWLAGGGHKPVTAASWKERKPKSRVSGVLGLGVHGLRAGQAYVRSTPVVKEGGEGAAPVAEEGGLRNAAQGPPVEAPAPGGGC